MNSEEKVAPNLEPSCYSDSEIELMRLQLRVGNAEAARVLTEKGYQLDPRIAEARKQKESA